MHVGQLSAGQFAALKQAEKKVFRRVLIPCIFLMVVNYLDRCARPCCSCLLRVCLRPDQRLLNLPYCCRTNLSFAAVQLNEALGFNEKTYGLGAGMFFATCEPAGTWRRRAAATHTSPARLQPAGCRSTTDAATSRPAGRSW